MLDHFQENLESTGLVPSGARVLLGYSGGADSCCLLHLLVESGRDVVAAHLHHGQRAEADDELEKCAEVAERLGIPFVSGRADVPALALAQRTGLEEAGRNARYTFFESARKSADCHLIATAHTLDDHIETILFRLARGTGLAGLRGIPTRRDRIVRPLLAFGRAQTRQYCLDRGLWFHDDPANADIENARVRIRNRVTPELAQINSRYRESIARLSHTIAKEDDFLNSMAAAVLEKCEVVLNGNLSFLTVDCEIAFSRSRLLEHPGVLWTRGIRLAASALGGSLDHHQTNEAERSLTEIKGSVTCGGGTVCLEWQNDVVHFRQLYPDQAGRSNLNGSGWTHNPNFGWSFSSDTVPPDDFLRERGGLDVVMDASKIRGQLYTRTADPTMSIQPLGFNGLKTLSDLFQEKKLTHAARKRLPIVCDFIGPVWIPGVTLVERVKITEDSTNGLRLSLCPYSGPEP